MFVYLTKITEKGHERYYKIISSPNLLGEHLVVREYGNTSFKKPTRTLENTFENDNDANKFFNQLKKQKLHRGYLGKCA